MSRLPEQIENSIRARKLFSRGRNILVAVSGGVDSMVLLHALHRLAPEHGWHLTVAHFNHQLRGRSSDADERLVCAVAKKLGLPFVAGRADVRKFARARKISIEMAARGARHGFLARAAKQRRISTIALAHHADDQVELFFLRLLRGSGGEGLAGMKWVSPSPADAKIKLVRPLLDLPKSGIEKFARENKIRFREDASNRSPDFLRNRIRRELLPLLRKNYQPALDKTILRAMEIAGAEAEFVSAAARAFAATKPLRRRRRGDARPTKRNFAKMPVAVQRRKLQAKLLRHGVAPNFDLIERLREYPNEVMSVDSRRGVSRDKAGKIQVHRAVASKFRTDRVQLDLGAAGSQKFAHLIFSWSVARPRAFRPPATTSGQESFDADKIGSRIVLRHWQAGDRFQPIGMGAAVKLQDLFVNAKIPRERRHELVVAEVGGEIFWVEGLRIGERFKLTSRTARRLEWRWQRA